MVNEWKDEWGHQEKTHYVYHLYINSTDRLTYKEMNNINNVEKVLEIRNV